MLTEEKPSHRHHGFQNVPVVVFTVPAFIINAGRTPSSLAVVEEAVVTGHIPLEQLKCSIAMLRRRPGTGSPLLCLTLDLPDKN